MADSFQLKAIITAVDQLSGPLKGMSKNLKGFQKDAKNIMVNAAAMGTAIASAFVIPINQAMEFESSMADVRKVVNFDTPAQFKEMGEDVLKLSTRLPMAANGIAQIVAAGGQAGIAREDLQQFASDAVKMGVAFDQTAEESGQMMAQWRTAFKMTQKDVVGLADKINYLGNTGPASAGKISEIVTRIGPLGGVAGVASGEIAAMGATIAGMGVESEIAATGIKNFMLSLTSGKSATSSQKKALKFIKIDPAQLAADMQKDSKKAMLKVLDSLAKVPKEKQAAVMNALFGKESLGAIAPLLTNLDLLRKNFGRVSDAQQYGASMQKEYESRAATTSNSVQLLKNQFTAASITIGDMFLPTIVKLSAKVQPLIERFRQFVKTNPEMVKGAFKFGVTLLGTASAFGVATKAFKTFDSVMKMTTMGKLLALVVLAGSLIVSNWDQAGPVVKKVWENIDGVAQALGGWENVLKGVAFFTAGAWLASMVKGFGGANTEAGKLSKNLKGIANMGVITVTISVLFDLMKRVNNLHDEAAKQNTDVGTLLVNKSKQADSDRGYQGFIPRLKELLGMDQSADTSKPLLQSQKGQQGELKVSFENAPPGMRVEPAGNSLPWLNFDVGYNRFSNQ
ncbi:phage tail tape measure protein [Citrobacter sp. wls613]|uniref:phage tail tape measure protein n=1 Tax=Citrobacter sp. wls613 TaxID=2576436 RepID=UPI0010CA705D|nr:phage tail tape measure protein [Citrobacter sp. wls613]TKV19536.1 phage tail tape measure protein [Citrobacter sp. wls613]